MAARKVDLAKAKEARQKKLLLALVPVLAILLLVQVPKLLKHSSAPAAAPASTVTTTTPAGTTTVPVAATQLADTDVAPTPSEGQLVRFDLFQSKDPFVQQVQDVAATDTTPAATAAPPTTTPKPAPATVAPVPSTTIGAYTTSSPDVPRTSVARIVVNGKAENVVADGSFPAAAPAFTLVSFTTEKAEISVVGGSFQSGAPTLTLLQGQTLTLENTADGTRFVLIFRGARKVPTASLPAPTVTTTTPAAG